MREFLLDVFASLILAITAIVLFSTLCTIVIWDYTWMFTSTGLTLIRILGVIAFVGGMYAPLSEFKKEKLKEHDEKISN